MKRKIAYIGFGFAAGLFVSSLGWGMYNTKIIILSSLITFLLFLLLRNQRLYVATAAISFFIGISYFSCYTYFVYDKIISYDGQNIIFTGDVIDYSYDGSDQGRLTVEGRINGNEKTEISFFVPDGEYEYYDQVEIKAKVAKIEDTLKFPDENYNRPKGVFLKGVEVSSVSVIEKNKKPILKAIKNYRDYLFNKINSIVEGDEGGFLGAMLCGDKSELSSITKSKLYRSGIGHIFSVSGTHMFIVSAFFGGIFNLFIKNRRIKFILMEVVIWSFALFSGLSPSVTRAAIMITVLLLSDLLFRFGDCMNTLGWVCLLIPVTNPYIVRSPSFLLSLSGAVGIGAVAPQIIKKIKFKGLVGKIVKSAAATLTVMFVSMPVSLFFFDEISLIAPAANLVLVPVCTAALSLTVIVAVTGGAGFVAVPVLKTAGWFIHWVIYASDKISMMSYSYVTISNITLKFIVTIICFFVIAWALVSNRFRYYAASAVIAYGVVISAFNINFIIGADLLHFVFLPNNKGYQVVIYQKDKCVILDMGAKGKNNSAVQRLLTKKGIKTTKGVMIFKECYYTAQTYEESIYPEPQAFYGDFDSQNNVYKTNNSVPFGNMEISESELGYKTTVNGIEVEFSDSNYYIDGEIQNITEEEYPIELVFKDDKYEVRSLDYGFD